MMKAVPLVNVHDNSAPYGRRRLFRAVCAAGLGFALVGAGALAGPAQADDLDSQRHRVDDQLDASRARLANLSQKSQEAVLNLQATQARLATAQQALAAARAQEQAATERKATIDADLVIAKKEEADGLARLAAIRAEQVRNTDIRNNMARQAYEGSGLERIAAVLNTDKAKDLADNMYVVEKVNDNQNALLGELAAARAKADAEQAKLAETRRRIAGLQLEAEAAVQQAAQARALADSMRAELADLEGQQKAAAAAVAAQRTEEAARVKELQAQSDAIAARLAALAREQGGAGAPPSGNGRFALPVNGPFTSEFGYRINPVLHTAELHSGLDIGAGCGAPVYASGEGTIVHAGVMGGYGNSIWINHGGGIVTTYNHMSGYAKSGGSVARGELIGYVGTTGLSTGCHMHWEVRVNGAPVNPRGWF